MLSISSTGSFLDVDSVNHLNRLTYQWDIIADLGQFDICLYIPIISGGFKCVDQISPTGIHFKPRPNLIGSQLFWQPLEEVVSSCEISIIRIKQNSHESLDICLVPVCLEGAGIAVLFCSRIMTDSSSAQLLAYEQLVHDFKNMVTTGDFPYDTHKSFSAVSRVVDGVVVCEANGNVVFCDSTARIKLAKLGVDVVPGSSVNDFGLETSLLERSIVSKSYESESLVIGELVCYFQVFPLLNNENVDLLLLTVHVSPTKFLDYSQISSIDTTVREIHHRVKNNLQTVSSILRLQSRRVNNSIVKIVIEDSIRRIASISLVHELLSKKGLKQVYLDEIILPILDLLRTSFTLPHHKVEFDVKGTGPKLAEAAISSIAVIITELVQNSLIHGFPESYIGNPKVMIEMQTLDSYLVIKVIDNGVGVTDTFSLDDAGLGLTIVKSLVEGDLNGDLSIQPGDYNTGCISTVSISI